MKREAILEFRLNEDLYCFNTKIVKYVFDLEEFEEFEGLDKAVIGLVRYENDAMLLIDTLFLYTGEKHISLEGSKSVVVIEDGEEALYGMLVDEIIKIEDVEPAPSTVDLSSDEMPIHHYKERDKLINEVVPVALLHAKKIPSLKKMSTIVQDSEDEEFQNKNEFLLFEIDSKLFALDTAFVKEVVDRENDFFELEAKSRRFRAAVAIRENVYKVAHLKPNAQNGNELVVVQKKKEHFCIAADHVFGIEFFETKKIEPLEDTYEDLKGFYNKNGQIVAIINENFFIEPHEDQKSIDTEKESKIDKNRSVRKGFLIFKLGEKDFALDMRFVRQVVEEEDIPHTGSVSISSMEESHVAYISEWNHHGVEVISLASMLGIDDSNTTSKEVIMLEIDEKFNGILVDKVDDIYYAKQQDIAFSDDKEVVINGALFKERNLIAILNPYKVA